VRSLAKKMKLENEVFVSCFSSNDLNDSGQNKEKQCLHCPNLAARVDCTLKSSHMPARERERLAACLAHGIPAARLSSACGCQTKKTTDPVALSAGVTCQLIFF